jgi:hypothetical protein
MNKGFRAGHGQMWLAGDDANRQPGQLNRPCRLSYRLRDRSQGEVGGDPGAHVGDHGRRPGTDSSVPQSTCKPFVQPDVDICHDLHGDGRRERVLRHPQTCVEPAAAQALVELVRRVVGSGFTDTLKPLIMVGCAIADRERAASRPVPGSRTAAHPGWACRWRRAEPAGEPLAHLAVRPPGSSSALSRPCRSHTACRHPRHQPDTAPQALQDGQRAVSLVHDEVARRPENGWPREVAQIIGATQATGS